MAGSCILCIAPWVCSAQKNVYTITWYKCRTAQNKPEFLVIANSALFSMSAEEMAEDAAEAGGL